MYGGKATGRRYAGGSGFGFRGSSPPYPYIGRGRGGLPRCQYPGLSYHDTPFPAYRTPMTNEQELDLLKRQAGEMKRELEKIASRIRDLEANDKE